MATHQTRPNPRALIAAISSAIARHPAPFGQDARVAIGTGSHESPSWLLVALSVSDIGRVVSQSTLPTDTDAALFLPADGGESLIAGNRALLEATVRHFLGGMNLLGMRSAAGGAQ